MGIRQRHGFRVGARVTGYFTYESALAPGLQTSSRPNFVFEVPETQFRFERTSHDFFVHNNWSPPGQFVVWDGFELDFSYPQGFGALTLHSSNTAMFTNSLLPPTLPPLEQFDAGRTLYVTLNQVQPYRTTAVQIDRLWVVPGSGLGQPVIFGIQPIEAGPSFRFLTEPSTSYAVEVTDNLANANWLTVTNIGIDSARDPIALITAAGSGPQQRFYRIRKSPN